MNCRRRPHGRLQKRRSTPKETYKSYWKQINKMQLLSLTLLALILQLTGSQASSGSFVYSRGPVPDTFHQGTRYPDRSETDECRPIRLRVERNSILYRTQLVTNTHPRINFQSADARLMTARLQSRLNALAAEYYRQYSRRITVLQAWSEYAADDGLGDPHSLHYEGKWAQSGC